MTIIGNNVNLDLLSLKMLCELSGLVKAPLLPSSTAHEILLNLCVQVQTQL